MEFVKRLWSEDEGADATEYALLAALIAVAIIGGAGLLGTSIGALFTRLSGTVDGGVAGGGV